MRLGLVGPLPPPTGGMANQTRQIGRLLSQEGIEVCLVRTNEPYRPAWIGGFRGLRAIFRLIPYRITLGKILREVDVVHVMANSGWAWHLFAAPAIRMARLRRVPVVVNYRGGLAGEFLSRSGEGVRAALRHCGPLVVPSRFLQRIFAQYDIKAQIIPNIVDLEMFKPPVERRCGGAHIVVARNLERIYGIDTAVRATAILRGQFPGLTVSIAGAGRERPMLERLAVQLGVAEIVRFTGSLEIEAVAALYRDADLVLNPSRVDNTPNSLLEAAASGVPIVSTDVGGVPCMVEHGKEAWLVPHDQPELMAEGVSRVLRDTGLRDTLRLNGLALARSCSWRAVGPQWLELYRRLVGNRVLRSREPVRAEE